MPRKNQEQPDVPPFEVRPGVGLPTLGGMYRRADPAQIPPHRLHLGVNIRLANGEMGSRPGLTFVEGQQEEACITGIFEIEDFAVAVYIDVAAEPALDGSGNKLTTPFRIMAFNEEKETPVQNYWDEDATIVKTIPTPWRVVGSVPGLDDGSGNAHNTFQIFNGALLILNDQSIYEADFSEDDEAPRLDLTFLVSLPGTDYIVSSCLRRERVDDAQTGDEFDKDVLYLGANGGKIYRYDGTTLELVKTLSSGGPMIVHPWGAAGLVAAGANAGGFTYQEQVGFSWTDQAWGLSFNCNGITEWLGEIVFVGDYDDVLASGKWGGYALRWAGSGAPTTFHSNVPATVNDDDVRFSRPLVAAGALHFIEHLGENIQPPEGATSVLIKRFESFGASPTNTQDIGQVPAAADEQGFFINYQAGMLLFGRTQITGVTSANDYDRILYVLTGNPMSIQQVYEWADDASSANRITGTAHEAIPL